MKAYEASEPVQPSGRPRRNWNLLGPRDPAEERSHGGPSIQPTSGTGSRTPSWAAITIILQWCRP
jgi:hypothetical protein